MGNRDRILPFVVHAYNTSVQSSTQVSPFKALYGRDPRLPPDLSSVTVTASHADAIDWWLFLQQHQPLLRRAIHQNLHIAQQRQKRLYDEGRQEVRYSIGDLVFVYYPIRRRGLSESLLHRWIGPYRVTAPIRQLTYRLHRLSNGTTTSAHVSRMKPYYPPVEPPTPTTPEFPSTDTELQGGSVAQPGRPLKRAPAIGGNVLPTIAGSTTFSAHLPTKA